MHCHRLCTYSPGVAGGLLAEPEGQLLLDFNPLGWMVDYLVIWPLVWFGGELLRAGQVLNKYRSSEEVLKLRLRLSGGILLIYLCVWLVAVPLIGQFSLDYPGLAIDQPSYSQVLRFLLGAGGALAITTARKSYLKSKS